MSRILRRPMFRGGRVNSYGTGIATGLADGGRVGFRTGGSYLTLPEPVTNKSIGRTNAMPAPGITGISIADFFKPVSVTGQGFSDYRPGDRLRIAEREKFPMYDEFVKETETESDDDGTIRLASTDIEGIKLPKQTTKSEANVEADLPTSKIEEPDAPGKTQETIKTPKVNEVDEAEVTMTDLEKALGLDDAKREYASDALAAASKAFFEGRGFEAISDAAAVKSKAPEIKRLAGLEEFKLKKQKEMFDLKEKRKQFAPGNVEKTVEYLVRNNVPRDEAIKRATKQSATFAEALGKHSVGGTILSSGFKLAAEEFYGGDYKGDVTATEVISGDKSTELADGVYTDSNEKLIFTVKDKKVTQSRDY